MRGLTLIPGCSTPGKKREKRIPVPINTGQSGPQSPSELLREEKNLLLTYEFGPYFQESMLYLSYKDPSIYAL
jgi:hypothetical protein